MHGHEEVIFSEELNDEICQPRHALTTELGDSYISYKTDHFGVLTYIPRRAKPIDLKYIAWILDIVVDEKEGWIMRRRRLPFIEKLIAKAEEDIKNGIDEF